MRERQSVSVSLEEEEEEKEKEREKFRTSHLSISTQTAVTNKFRLGLRLTGEVCRTVIYNITCVRMMMTNHSLLSPLYIVTYNKLCSHAVIADMLTISLQLLLTGVIEEDLGTSLLMEMLSTVTKADKDGHPYLSVVLHFARHCSEDIAGIVPRQQRSLMSKFELVPPRSQV